MDLTRNDGLLRCVPRCRPGVRVLGDDGGFAVVAVAGQRRVVAGLPAADLKVLLEACDGRRSVAVVARRLAAMPADGGYDEAAVIDTLTALDGRVLDLLSGDAQPPGPVAVWGSGEGRMMELAAEALEAAGLLAPRRRLRLTAADTPGGGATVPPAPAVPPVALVPAVPRDAALVLLAPDAVPYEQLEVVAAAVEAAGVPCLPLLCEAGAVWVGPLLAPRGLASADSHHGAPRMSARMSPLGSSRRPPGSPGRERLSEPNGSEAPSPDLLLAARCGALEAAQEALRIVFALPSRPDPPRLLGRLRRIAPDGTVVDEVVEPPSRTAPGPWHLEAELEVAGRAFPEPRRRRAGTVSPSGSPRTVTVVGGGTAGYLAALALRRKLPSVEVTLLESPKVPVIGVGEATTPLLPAFLHGTLGLDPAELWREVRPTPKLGVRFLWGAAPSSPRQHDGFSYPFLRGPLVDSLAHEGHLDAASLPALLMAARRAPVVRGDDGEPRILPFPWAYHLENRRFVAYLRSAAEAAGVRRREATVEAAVPRESGEGIRHLMLDDGSVVTSDLYLDCTGFRSLLLGETLGEEWHSYRSSLFTDAAWVGSVERPLGAPPVPYTEAHTWDSGWCWNTPTPERDHRGYVFSRDFLDPSAAEAEMRRRLPALGDVRLVNFEPGRRGAFWRGNVVALGNSYGFVEPLESTALHMLVVSIHLLVRHWPNGDEPVARAQANRHLGDFWDDLRGFLALHFRYNRRLSTPFWRACREQVDLGDAAEAVALFRERGPLSYRPHLMRFDSLWGDFGRDVLLLGQGVEAPLAVPALDAATWRRRLASAQRLAHRCLPVDEALQLLAQSPEPLRRWARSTPWLADGAVGGTPGW